MTERTAPDFPDQTSPRQSKAECNPDEVVTGGGWITPYNTEEGIPISAMEILKNNASGNGWIVEMTQGLAYSKQLQSVQN